MNPLILKQIMEQICEKCGKCTITILDDGWTEIKTIMPEGDECTGWVFFHFNKHDCPIKEQMAKEKVKVSIE